jgi:hypothetical protein
MGSFFITLAFVTILVVTGIVVNMRLYDPGTKRFRQSRSLRPVARRYTTGGMSDAEYFIRLDKMYEDGPRYARRGVMIMFALVIFFIVVVISLLSGLH